MVKDFLDAVHSPAYLLFVLSLIPFELINGVVVVGILQLLILVNLFVCVYNFVHLARDVTSHEIWETDSKQKF